MSTAGIRWPAPAPSASVETYLDRYAPDRPELGEAVPVALRLGWACRAVNGHVEGDDDTTRTRLRMFLDGTP